MSVFNEFVHEYDLWYERPFGKAAYELELECIKKLTSIPENSLEVGVGTGRFASRLGVKYGLDPSVEMLRIAKERGILTVAGVGEEMPFKDGSFETLLIVVSMCFVQKPAKVILESHRVLKPTGKLLIGLVLSESPWAEFYRKKAEKGHPIYKHAKFYSRRELECFLHKGGFRIKSVACTLFEEPQDEKPVGNREIAEGFKDTSGFTCILAEKI